MKQAIRILEITLFVVMVVSSIFFATKLNFGSSNDKEPIYWIFFFLVLVYVFVCFLLIMKSYKTNQVVYRKFSIILGIIYVVFLIYLYLN